MMRSTATLASILFLFGCSPRDPRGHMSTIEGSTSAGGDFTRAGFDDLDIDSDHQLSSREFYEMAENYYDDWDIDEDGRLTASELAQGLFESWDRNHDNAIDRGEHEVGVAAWVPATLRADFERWDANRNESIDRAETREGVAQLRLFSTYDRNGDGSISDLEFSRSVFRYWDADGDDRLTMLEWNLGREE